MQKMLDYVEKLDELDTSEVEPMSHIFQDENVFREDVVTNGDNKEAMLANAPKAKEGQYQVPKTIGQETGQWSWKINSLQLGEKIKQRQVSVLDGVKTVFEQIEKQDSEVHAYLDTYKEEAYKRAEEVQKGIEDGTYTSPLAGVPIAIKDNICINGKKTTCASKILENFVPQYNAEVIDRLERAGLVIIGKTNMDEFAMGSTTETSAYGITRNPWNLEHVPGGSSGGSCAAVAAGETYLALGSDTGGSIRQPSSYCGVTGIRPTYGTVSRYGLVAYASSLDQIGPVGKTYLTVQLFWRSSQDMIQKTAHP